MTSDIETQSLDETIFQAIRTFFYKRTGNWLTEDKRYLILYRLSSMVGPERDYSSYDELYNRVKESPYGEDAHKVITALTTHYSFFFRESEHFEFLQRYLLKQIKMKEEIRIWSGACSTGEEPYSIAISSILALPKQYHRVKILGTDISNLSIEKAKKGIYSKGIVEATLAHSLIDEFFIQEKENLRVCSTAQNMVQFSPLNLMDNLPFKKQFNIIFLRNIFYYMNPEKREQVLNKIFPYLTNGGVLITGHMDSAPIHKLKLRSLGNSMYMKE